MSAVQAQRVDDLPSDPKMTSVERIAEAIRNGILSGALQPGEHLCQRTAAARHESSKVPVREAFMQLHTEGLLEHDRHRGYFVTRVSFAETRQIFRMRRWIETELLFSLTWPSPETIESFKVLQGCISAYSGNASRTQRYDALVKLRLLLFGLSPHKTLLREAERLWVKTDRLHAFFSPEGRYDFADALEGRDRDLLLRKYGAERDEVEGNMAEARISLPGIWTNLS